MSKAYYSPYVHAGHLWLLDASDIRVSPFHHLVMEVS